MTDKTLPFIVRPGNIFIRDSKEKVLQFLQQRKLERINTMTPGMTFVMDDDQLTLELKNGRLNRFPVRESLLAKLMNWYHIPNKILYDFDPETTLMVLNNILKIIKGQVTVSIEDGEALTIVSRNYAYIEDQVVISKFDSEKIDYIDRNDHYTRIYFKEINRIEPQVGDYIGCAYNLFNSETGLRAFEITAFLLRLVCSNGMVVPVNQVQSKIIHYNINPRIAYDMIEEVKAHLPILFQTMEHNLMRSISIFFDPDKPVIKNCLNGILGFPKGNQLLAEYALQEKENKTLYDFYNFITSTANEVKGLKSLQLQRYAGEIISGKKFFDQKEK
jgi:hypothetical protein